MVRTRRVVRLFLASPNDVKEERRLTELVVAELNRSVGPKLGLFLELVRWEDMLPGMGRPQQLILDQADIEEADLFIGILWNRFGTLTGRAESGTEEEFGAAYEHWQTNAVPRIMFYFSQRPATLNSHEELQQRSAVLTFRRKIEERGLVREHQNSDEFEDMLRQDLIKQLFVIQGHMEPATIRPRRVQRIRDSRVPEPVSRGKAPTVLTPRPVVRAGMVRIEAGAFLHGPSRLETKIDYDFYLDEFPVSNSEFMRFVDETGYMRHSPDPAMAKALRGLDNLAQTHGDHPARSVTWHDAAAYSVWIGKRLPSSIEWERGARGTDGRAYPWGDEFDHRRCNSLESGRRDTTPVGAFPEGRSHEGCYDLAGNVFEWVSDWTAEPRFSFAAMTEKINRGGSYNRSAEHLVCWHVESDPPTLRMLDVGFRCAWKPWDPAD
jgi:formylglycine-generating enzyme required for sulfatase activity